jgi:regulatory protein
MAESKNTAIGAALIERWALAYLERFNSSAENLRQVLGRRARRRTADPEILRDSRALIDALVQRYRDSGMIDDAAYAAARARGRLKRGEPLRKIAAGLAAKGIDAEDRASALAGLRDEMPDPDLAAACAFARRRRLGPFRRGPAERQRELTVFARAGFARREAEAVLACADPDAVEALLTGSE